ncbi:MAG: hypothetical protein GX446_15510 [Chthonomonadales bacterium]|nr:hypothetical protein [Chthonomonadales bacterium]
MRSRVRLHIAEKRIAASASGEKGSGNNMAETDNLSRRLPLPQRKEARAAIADLRWTDEWLQAAISGNEDDRARELWAAIERDPFGFMADLVTFWNVFMARVHDRPSLALELYADARRKAVGHDDVPADPEQREWLTEELVRFFEDIHQQIMAAVQQPGPPTIERIRELRGVLTEINRVWYNNTAVEWLRRFHDRRVQVQLLAEGTGKIETENLPREEVPGAAAIAFAERQPGEPIATTINRFEREPRKARPDGRTTEVSHPGGGTTRHFVPIASLDELTATGAVQTLGGLARNPIEEWIEAQDERSSAEHWLAKLRELPLRGRLRRIRDLIVADPARFVTEHNQFDCVELASAVGGTPGQVAVELARLRRKVRESQK